MSVPPPVGAVFFGIVSLIFSKFCHGARNPCEIMCDRGGFYGIIPFPEKFGKWTENGPKTRFGH